MSFPLFGGRFFYMPNVAASTARLYESEMHRAVGKARFQMRHWSGEEPNGCLLGDALAFCQDEAAADVFTARGFHQPEPITDELVITGRADSLEEAAALYPMLAMTSQLAPDEVPEVISRLQDTEIYREPAMRKKPPSA